LCNFFFNTYVLIFLVAHGFYIFKMATGPLSSLVIEKKNKAVAIQGWTGF